MPIRRRPAITTRREFMTTHEFAATEAQLARGEDPSDARFVRYVITLAAKRPGIFEPLLCRLWDERHQLAAAIEATEAASPEYERATADLAEVDLTIQFFRQVLAHSRVLRRRGVCRHGL